jgi:hypothetical protein
LEQAVTARKAIHIGTCQACGSTQKLPLGVLSQHGYEVQWSQFQGVCIGRGHLPYELSAEILPELIAAAELRRSRMIAAQTELRTPTIHNAVRYTFKRRQSINFPEAARIEHEDGWGDRRSAGYFAVADRDGQRESVPHWLIDRNVTGSLDLVNSLRRREADALDSSIAQDTNYIAWQTRRLADWKSRPLQDVVEAEEAEAAKKTAGRAEKKAARDAKRAAKILRDGERAARLIAKYEKLVPSDIRANLAKYTHSTLHDEMKRRDLKPLPSTVRFLLSDMLSEATGEGGFRYVANPWKQVEAAKALQKERP